MACATVACRYVRAHLPLRGQHRLCQFERLTCFPFNLRTCGSKQAPEIQAAILAYNRARTGLMDIRDSCLSMAAVNALGSWRSVGQ